METALDKMRRSRHIRGMTVPRVQPIIPTRRKEPFDDPEWLFDFKYDGFRAVCYLERGRCGFISRNGNVFSRFEALGDQLAAILQIDEAIIDGEVIAADEARRPQFFDLLRGAQAPAYVAFDLLWVDGADLRSLPLSERRQRLQAVLPEASAIVSEALSVTGRGCELFDLMCVNDLEGIVAKRLADRYDTRACGSKSRTPIIRRRRDGAICSTGHGSAQRIRQGGGELLHGPADDAWERRRGSCAADRVVQSMRPPGRA
jgi:bifunctional non-homologous end joining protein LigD